MANIILEVPDISCAHCERTVTGALQGQPGVRRVQVDVPGKVVYLDYDPATLPLAQVQAVLDEEGYPVAGTREGAAPAPGKGTIIPLTSQ
jgi:copper chaperone